MRLAICAEQWLFASVLAAAFECQGHDVVASTDQPAELLETVAKFHIDLCVLDVFDDLPVTVTRLRELSHAPYVVLLADPQDDRAWDAYDHGCVDGVMSKTSGLQTVTRSIESVARGARRCQGRPIADRRRPPVAVDSLTARELDVLRLVVRGYSTERMADELGVSRHTVRTHVQQVLRKLGVHGRGKIARAAAAAGLVDVSDLIGSGHR